MVKGPFCLDSAFGHYVPVLVPTSEAKFMSSNKPVIAVIEDDRAFREALAGMLTSFGYEALEFSGAREFLDSPDRERTSCVISDIQMPVMTGLELHEKIRASGRPIPTVLITALPSPEGRTRALNAGAVCYLAKPFVEEDLLACIKRALGTRT